MRSKLGITSLFQCVQLFGLCLELLFQPSHVLAMLLGIGGQLFLEIAIFSFQQCRVLLQYHQSILIVLHLLRSQHQVCIGIVLDMLSTFSGWHNGRAAKSIKWALQFPETASIGEMRLSLIPWKGVATFIGTIHHGKGTHLEGMPFQVLS